MELSFSRSRTGNGRHASMLPTSTRLRARLILGAEPRHHRLVSQGMLGVYGGRGCLGAWEQPRARASLWGAIAPTLETEWARGSRSARARYEQPIAAFSAEQVEAVLALAEAAGLCSFAQTLEAASDYLLGDDGSRLHALACKSIGERVPFDAIRGVSLEPIDAGHTASVMRVGLTFADRGPQWLALLVARDLGAAASRLSAQASDLRVWHRLSAAHAPEIFDDGTGRIRWFDQIREVVIVAARWIDGRAVQLRDSATGPLLSAVAGEPLTDPDASILAQRLAIARSALATFALDGACERTLDLEQGNVLATAANEVVLVGSAARSWWGPLGAWPYRLAAVTLPVASSSASAPASLHRAVEAVRAGLTGVLLRTHGPDVLSVMLRQARSMELAQRALEGLAPVAARDLVIRAIQAALPWRSSPEQLADAGSAFLDTQRAELTDTKRR
jgi:hypothetical protein